MAISVNTETPIEVARATALLNSFPLPTGMKFLEVEGQVAFPVVNEDGTVSGMVMAFLSTNSSKFGFVVGDQQSVDEAVAIFAIHLSNTIQ